MTTDITELIKLKAIRKQVVLKMKNFSNVGHYGTFYIVLPRQGKKLTRAMIYSFDEDYLFFDALRDKLGDLFKPGDSIRVYDAPSEDYLLIQDDFSFYAAALDYFRFREYYCVMNFYVNGSELLTEFL